MCLFLVHLFCSSIVIWSRSSSRSRSRIKRSRNRSRI